MGLDYILYWKRALLSGIACQVLGNAREVAEVEELYLAGLLQDLGMLALDQIFPDRLRVGVAGSGNQTGIPAQGEQAPFTSCVFLSGMIAELFLRKTDDVYLQFINQQASSLLQLTPETLMNISEKIKERLPETARLCNTSIQPCDDPQTILEHARESLLSRNLLALQQIDELRMNTVNTEERVSNLQETHRHDPLTGVFTRAHLDKWVETSFAQAVANGKCFTLIFGDLDKFKSVNDTYSHQAGDVVLQSAAHFLQSQIRGSDLVGRFGGEEFVLILAESENSGAEMASERILEAFRHTSHEISEN